MAPAGEVERLSGVGRRPIREHDSRRPLAVAARRRAEALTFIANGTRRLRISRMPVQDDAGIGIVESAHDI